MTNTMQSELLSLKDMTEPQSGPQWRFSIPIYQRPYVWGYEHINTLLNDIYNAFEENREAPGAYYLGTVMVTATKDKESSQTGEVCYDLVNGQQRFTTLWLIANRFAQNKQNLPIKAFTAIESNGQKTPRLRFAIRDTINDYLTKMLNNSGTNQDEDSLQKTETLGKALKTIDSFFAGKKKKDQEALAAYIYEKVKIVVNQAPKSMDLNKLFEVINDRGVQLQHHELLKSQILHTLPSKERNHYAALWDASSDMSGFIEHNLAAVTSLKAKEIAALYYNKKLSNASDIEPSIQGAPSTSDEHSEVKSNPYEGKTLESILKKPAKTSEENDDSNQESEQDEESTWANGIINFTLFLQHCLRIWLFEQGRQDVSGIKDKQLLNLFQDHFFNAKNIAVESDQEKSENARGFLSLMWQLRVIWDDYLIKWVEQLDNKSRPIKIHQLCSTTVSSQYISRSRNSNAHQGLSLLQSMLYHTQENTTHYWLTPYLYYLKTNLSINPDTTELEQAFNYLCHLDNHLLGEASEYQLVKRSRWFMGSVNPWPKAENLTVESELAVGEKNHQGVDYPHYWFYKLDFVLWYESKKNPEQWRDYQDNHWDNFRFTAKNSVEHISPQNPTERDDHIVSSSWRDSFGNLTLVSRSINSEYGNRPVNEKKERYKNKRKIEERPESLKMDIIYQQENWGDDEVKKHHEDMLERLRTHYKRDFYQLRKTD